MLLLQHQRFGGRVDADLSEMVTLRGPLTGSTRSHPVHGRARAVCPATYLP